MLYKKIEFRKFSDDRGDLTPLEFGTGFSDKDIPFNVKRSHFISGLDKSNATRGNHAHKNLEQVIICINGSFTLNLDDGKGNKESLLLNSRTTGIYIKDLVWRELSLFSDDCIVLFFCSHHYDNSDHIRDYSEFLNIVNKSKDI